jgi:putative membrane protein
MVFLIVNWVLGASALFLLTNIFPGFRVTEFQSAILAAGVVGLISALIATILKQVTSPAVLVISAVLLLIVDTFVFRVTALIVPGFAMQAFLPAFAGALLLVAIHLVVLHLRARRHAVESEPLVHL